MRWFTVLYNSECDSLRPCPVAELIQQLEREEKEERDSLSTSSSHNMLRLLDKKADPKTIEDARAKYSIAQNVEFSRGSLVGANTILQYSIPLQTPSGVVCHQMVFVEE
uniref:Uncharacterized protein n=1 Tax=Timema cristinae TaxID=61476 RepID=A0A7R9GX19_TIMCR|nr:unnamed protein product [Timema cristinae]